MEDGLEEWDKLLNDIGRSRTPGNLLKEELTKEVKRLCDLLYLLQEL